MTGLLPPNWSLSKPARKGHPDTLRRIAAKQGWYDAQQQCPREVPQHFLSVQVDAYYKGYDLGIDAPTNQKHPFGEITNTRVPL